MLLNTAVAAAIQIVNVHTLRAFPLLWTTAANTGMAVLWLLLAAVITAPADRWDGDASLIAAGATRRPVPSTQTKPDLRPFTSCFKFPGILESLPLPTLPAPSPPPQCSSAVCSRLVSTTF